MSGLDQDQFLQYVMRPALDELGENLNSLAAERLLMGTALQESGLVYLRQLGAGPALGIYQMEPATHEDIWDNFLKYHTPLLLQVGSRFTAKPERLIWDLKYATKMARLHYYRVKEALPEAGDVAGMAAYWKRYYNTPAGKGTEEEFVKNWEKSLDNRPDP